MFIFSTKQHSGGSSKNKEEQWCHTLQKASKGRACKLSLNLKALRKQNVKLELLHVQYNQGNSSSCEKFKEACLRLENMEETEAHEWDMFQQHEHKIRAFTLNNPTCTKHVEAHLCWILRQRYLAHWWCHPLRPWCGIHTTPPGRVITERSMTFRNHKQYVL